MEHDAEPRHRRGRLSTPLLIALAILCAAVVGALTTSSPSAAQQTTTAVPRDLFCRAWPAAQLNRELHRIGQQGYRLTNVSEIRPVAGYGGRFFLACFDRRGATTVQHGAALPPPRRR